MEGVLTEVGPWAVVIAEDLEIFWAFQKGEGCLGGMRPDTAAIRCGYKERELKLMEGKVGQRGYRREEREA